MTAFFKWLGFLRRSRKPVKTPAIPNAHYLAVHMAQAEPRSAMR